MYAHNMAIAIKTDGQVLREHNGDTVFLPFGSEYSIFVKNLNNTRAIVTITVDGNDVVPGGLVVNANSEIDLQRSVVGNNLVEGNCFKFIERTAAIENHRGVKIDDGIVRVSFKYEKPPRPQFPTTHWKSGLMYPPGVRGLPASGASYRSFEPMLLSSMQCGTVSAQSTSNIGITVPGSVSSQQFVTVDDFATEQEEYVLILRLVGEIGTGVPIAAPVTVKVKKQCESCGTIAKSTAKFCANCGTYLTAVSKI